MTTPTLPAQPDSAFRRQVEADFAAISDDTGCNALYRPLGREPAGGVGGAASVRVVVSIKPDVNTAPPGARHASVGGTRGVSEAFGRGGATILVQAMGEAATIAGDGTRGVGTDGGVVRLQAGDVLVVPGWAVQRPADAAVVVRVAGGVSGVPGHFKADATVGEALT